MKYISEVESNLKNHVGKTVLYPKTLIIARNRAGKSAIVNACELALSATVSDVVGRALVKEVNRLLSLSREDRLWAKVTVSDGETDNMETRDVVEWATKGKKGSFVSQPVGLYNPMTVFPLRTVREALSGAVETTRKFFIRFVADGITDEDVLAQIPKPLQDAFQAMTTGIPRTAPVDMLLAGLGRAKEKLAALRSEVATRKDVVKETGQGLPPMPSEKEHAAALERIAELEVKIAEMDQLLGREQGNERLRGQYTTLRARKEEIEQVIDDLRDKLARAEESWPPKPSATDEIRPLHLAVLKFAQERNLEKCPTCQKRIGSLDLLPTVENRTAFWSTRVETVQAKVDEREGIAQAHGDHVELVALLKHDIDRQQQQFAGVEAQIEALGEMPEILDMSSFDVGYGDLKADLTLVRQEVQAMESARAAWGPLLKARDTAVEKEAEIDRWLRLIDALKEAIGNLLDKGRDAFVERVQTYLPKGDTFGLVLRDEDREVCQYGLMRDGKLHEALSGVEWAFVTAAIAAAAIPDNEKDKLHVIVFEDRSWDADTLLAVCTATTNLDAQVIIATAPPDGWMGRKFPVEWHVIDPTGPLEPAAKPEPMPDSGIDALKAYKEDEDKTPKFIREYIEKQPNATAADLVREFGIALNRAKTFLPEKPKRGKKKETKEPEVKKLPPELE